MNPVTINCYGCPRCHETHDFYEDAVECCQESPPELTRYQCTECNELHEDEDIADACCSEQEDEHLGAEYLRHVPHRQLELHGQLRLL